jgi:RNA-directed DNA polymerase
VERNRHEPALVTGLNFSPRVGGTSQPPPRLLRWLRLPSSALGDVLNTDSLHPHFHYRHFTKPKRDGGRREITAPDTKLKQVQYEIIRRYFQDQDAHPAAIAYRKQQSTADHAWAHAGADLIVTADVQDFFPSTCAERIERWWRERVDEDLARLLTQLTTYQGGLPQGAPTSPALSNFVNRALDERLTQRAAAAGACYTRYCDDLAFSWRFGMEPPADFESGVRRALHEFGYVLHPEKGWRVQSGREEPVLVGLVLTRHGKVRLPEEVRRRMDSLSRRKDASALERLAGYRGYEAMVVRRPGRLKARKRVRGTPKPTTNSHQPSTNQAATPEDEEIPF